MGHFYHLIIISFDIDMRSIKIDNLKKKLIDHKIDIKKRLLKNILLTFL